MIKVLKLKTIIKIVIILIAVIILITAIFKVIAYNKNENKEEYKILVDVEYSKLYLFKNGEVIEEYKCSGGKWSTPSPIGTWKITFKERWGEGFRTDILWGLMFLGEILEYMELLTLIL